MKAIAVHPGVPDSMHLREVDEPSVDGIPDGRGVLIETIRVGVDGTDKEINAAEYGDAPDGCDYLITGHENFGRVVEVGHNVPSTIHPGCLAVATVRRPGMSIYDAIGLQDMTTDDVYFERGINKLHGYLTELYVEDHQYVVHVPETLERVGVLLEPMTVGEKGINQAYEIQRRLKVWRPRRAAVLGAGTIGLLTALALRLRGLEVVCYSLQRPPYLNSDLIKALGGTYVSSQDAGLADVSEEHGPFDIILDATGFSPLVFEAAQVLGKNGVLVLASVTGGDRKVEVPSDAINQSFVLGNKVMVGTVNASREDFERSVDHLGKAEAIYPGWLRRLLTHPIEGLENHARMIETLTHGQDAIKVYVEVKAGAGRRAERPAVAGVGAAAS
jgi:threonine dehydrogenase-like Zn-dependent dehydrogenase